MLGGSFNHFIVLHCVIKDGDHFITGIMGSISDNNDYEPNSVKNKVIQHYLKEFPNREIAVVLLPLIRKVSEEQYVKESENFLPVE